MPVSYDTYYLTEDYFGAPYPELLAFFAQQPRQGRVLDLGCGQGRDALALARLGFSVTGVDHSAVGIAQLNAVAQQENLPLQGIVADMFAFDPLSGFGYILLDSLFHFGKKEKAREAGLFQRLAQDADPGTLLVVCLQDVGEKVAVLDNLTQALGFLQEVHREHFTYTFRDQASGYSADTPYVLVALRT